MDILTENEKKGIQEASREESAAVRWLVMQSVKHQKWVLSVIRGTFEEYYVTDMMSENVDLMVQCADYLNRGIKGSGLDVRQIELLDQLKNKYCG